MTSASRSLQDIQQWMTQYLARVVKVPVEQVDRRQPFSNYGLSSREALELVGDLEDWLGRECADTLIYDYPTIDKLSVHLTERNVA